MRYTRRQLEVARQRVTGIVRVQTTRCMCGGQRWLAGIGLSGSVEYCDRCSCRA